MNSFISWLIPSQKYTIHPISKYHTIIEQLRLNGRELTFTNDPQTIHQRLDIIWTSKFESLINRSVIDAIIKIPELQKIGHLLIQKYPFDICYIRNIHSNSDKIIIIDYHKWI